jgi:hypothetical protein
MTRDERVSDYLMAITIAKNKLTRHADHFEGADLLQVARDQARLQAILREWAGSTAPAEWSDGGT